MCRATTDVDALFFDTNVLVYANQRQSARHTVANDYLRRAAAAGVELWLSGQVIREFLAAVTRPQPGIAPTAMSVAIERARFFVQRFQLAEDGPEIRALLLELLITYPTSGKQVNDANLVATMLTYGVTCLLTFNAGDFRRFGELITIEAP